MGDDDRGILLVGSPDAGKTNFLVRFWLALRHGTGDLGLPSAPDDITYVESAVEHLLSGRFAPRSLPDDGPRDFHARVSVRRGANSGTAAEILVPDTLGEIWSKAVATREIDAHWMAVMQRCEGAALFVRIESDQNHVPLDWVSAQKHMDDGLGEQDDAKSDDLPTQVFLCELLRFLEDTLRAPAVGGRPRLAVIVTAWDLLGAERASWTPLQFLQVEFPMFAGRIEDTTRLEIEVFGSSVVGGDLKDDQEFKRRFHQHDPTKLGYVVSARSDGKTEAHEDLTLPIAWLLGVGGWKTR
jgi:hypothetical protein